MLNRRSLINRYVLAAVCLAAWTPSSRSEDATNMPEKLKPWKCADYVQRYFIKIEAPGEAGNIGLHADAKFACVSLPLKRIVEGAAERPEPVALVGEDGLLQPIAVRMVRGGSDTEIIFATFPGQRRFCLYTGSSKAPTEFSPMGLRPTPLQVHLKGASADVKFKASSEKPLTLKRFQQLEEQGIAALPPPPNGTANDLHPDNQPNIDDAECPYFGIRYSIFDVIKAPSDIYNPANYMAEYEGFLRTPVSGKYKFAIDTPGVAHLVIDGASVIAAEMPDDRREPFALNGSVELTEGVHRVVVYYAEANESPRKTNEDLRRFGIRLHWQPPFASGLMCIPPLAFVKYLPGVVVSSEVTPGTPIPFTHLETLGHVRVAAQKGDNAAREWVLVSMRTSGASTPAHLVVSAAGTEDVVSAAGQNKVCAWVPAGVPVEFKINSGLDSTKTADLPKRVASWPTLKTGLKESVEREVMDLEADLLVKSAPEFLYPNETGHIHVETVLTPKPVIVHKTRFDAKDFTGWELLPPPPRPMGEFTLYFEQPGASGTETSTIPATPDESERRKLRVSFPANLEQALKGTSELKLRLVVGGLECQQETFRVLHAQAPNWPGKLVMIGGELAFQTSGEKPETQRVVILVPHEDEAVHRHRKTLDTLFPGSTPNDILFIGDTLVEGASPAKGNVPTSGLSAALAKAKPSLKWNAIEISGPHRYRPLFRMLADLDAYVSASPDKKLPRLAVVNLGSGDVSRQTPLHTFERALDTLLARLSAGGVDHVVVVGAIPEPWRERQCEPYQERVDNVVKQHDVGGINLFKRWRQESNWTKRFVPDGETSDIAGPVPNKATIDEIVQLILSRM